MRPFTLPYLTMEQLLKLRSFAMVRRPASGWLKCLMVLVTPMIGFTAPASQAQSLTDFLRNSNLDALAKSNKILNLAAQSSNKSAQGDVNAFDDFFLVNGPGRLLVNFDKALQVKGQKNIPRRIGVAVYSNHEISADLQDGFEKVKQKYTLGSAPVSFVVIYKTLNMNPQLVYDYAIQRPPSKRCQEYLYIPQTQDFEKGGMTTCKWTLQFFKKLSGAVR
jgi:hypothetical protein